MTRRAWERAWSRYMGALQRLDASKGNPDGRVAAAARRSVRAAKRVVDSFNGK